MKNYIVPQQLIEFGLSNDIAENLTLKINNIIKNFSPEEAWQKISKTILTPQISFKIHHFLFAHLFPRWPNEPETAAAWVPEAEFIKSTNIVKAMARQKIYSYREFHAWSANHYVKFWDYAIKKLNIVFHKHPLSICDLSNGLESPNWLYGAKINIAESCFTQEPSKIAIRFKNDRNQILNITYGELDRLSNRIANSLVNYGFLPGDSIAIDMPMNHFAVAIYLGIIKMGGIVISIADSFSSEEISLRLRIAETKAIFTQDTILRGTKKLPLYEKVLAAKAPFVIVLPCEDKLNYPLRTGDQEWETFLVSNESFKPHYADPMDAINVLFSSGTTAEPKAIPWNHTTPIKVATDAFFHQNIQAEDVLAWHTNLGWMMGPWLIFAALMNHATLALYDGSPSSHRFGKFIEEAKVTMLGVVPSLVASWRQSNCMEGVNWQSIKLFSSTGECSNPEDMLFLMSLAGYKPIIEYCGGTEIGGAYVTSTVIQNNYLSICTTPALGLNFILLDQEGNPSNEGEVAIIPPSIGLSTELLNMNHHKVYFADMPVTQEGKILRRHGDQLRQYLNDSYSVLGRVDDTMNLNSIKISSAELERVLVGIENVIETAAIAYSPQHGPSQLIIYVATQADLNKDEIQKEMQARINLHLNPFFKIEDIVFIPELPKTASNKIMRRILRNEYGKQK